MAVLRPNEEWLQIITDLVEGEGVKREAARAAVWEGVEHYVQHVRRRKLPIGPLIDDDDAVRAISLRVMEKLVLNDFENLKRWRWRQLSGRDSAQWWTFIRIVVTSKAIDFARGSKRQIARRKSRKSSAPSGATFQWVREDPTDPSAVGDVMDATSRLLARSTEAQLIEILDWVNSVRAAAGEPESQTRSVSPRRRRSRGR